MKRSLKTIEKALLLMLAALVALSPATVSRADEDAQRERAQRQEESA